MAGLTRCSTLICALRSGASTDSNRSLRACSRLSLNVSVAKNALKNEIQKHRTKSSLRTALKARTPKKRTRPNCKPIRSNPIRHHPRVLRRSRRHCLVLATDLSHPRKKVKFSVTEEQAAVAAEDVTNATKNAISTAAQNTPHAIAGGCAEQYGGVEGDESTEEVEESENETESTTEAETHVIQTQGPRQSLTLDDDEGEESDTATEELSDEEEEPRDTESQRLDIDAITMGSGAQGSVQECPSEPAMNGTVIPGEETMYIPQQTCGNQDNDEGKYAEGCSQQTPWCWPREEMHASSFPAEEQGGHQSSPDGICPSSTCSLVCYEELEDDEVEDDDASALIFGGSPWARLQEAGDDDDAHHIGPIPVPAQDATQIGENKDAEAVFDSDMKFGPSVGLSRSERWERAYKLGLHPPNNVQH